MPESPDRAPRMPKGESVEGGRARSFLSSGDRLAVSVCRENLLRECPKKAFLLPPTVSLRDTVANRRRSPGHKEANDPCVSSGKETLYEERTDG